MRFLLDENLNDRRLVLRSALRDTSPFVGDVGLLSVSDARVFSGAVGQSLQVLARDFEDFTDLHGLIMAAGGHHPGVLMVRFDDDPRHNMTDRGIATAIHTARVLGSHAIADRLHVLNHWR